MSKDKKTLEKILADYLDCPCRIFEPMKDDSVLMEAYREATDRGKNEGFVPVLVCCNEIENLLETFLWNTNNEQPVNEEYSFDIEAVRAFRENMCKSELPDGKAILKKWGRNQYEDDYDDEDEDYENDEDDEDEDYKDEDYEDDYDDDYDSEEDDEDYDDDYDDDEDYDEGREAYENWKRECLREIAEEEDEYMMEPDTTFSSYISYDGVNSITTVLLAEIPVTNPWEIFAWVPFGGWNECPDTEDLMAVSKYWFEAYGAVPAAISHDVLEYMVPEPVSEKKAEKLAWEMMAFCPDTVLQGAGDVEILADDLTESTVWYFWWD